MNNGSYGVVTDENVLYYMWARYYNIDIKRFINQDVVEGSIATSPSLNQYAYCQGNPVKLTDPFGLSPFTSWSVLGHGLLDVLGFIPVIGAIPDTVNALWYLAEGDHFSAAASFVSAVPGWGDVIGAVGKTAKGCSKVSKMVRYGSKIVGRIGNIALGSYQTGSIAVSLYDKHVVQGESWDWDSTVQLFSAGLFATTTVVSAKGLKGDVGEYRRVVGSKYSEIEIKSVINNIKGDGFKNNPLRQAYESEVTGLREYGEELLASGVSEKQVAQTLNQARRDLGIKYKNATPQPLREYIYEINMQRYGDKLGPTYESMIKSGKSNVDIINSSSRPNSNIDNLLSGFEKWLRRQ